MAPLSGYVYTPLPASNSAPCWALHLPGPLPRPARDKGDETSGGRASFETHCHLKKLVGLDSLNSSGAGNSGAHGDVVLAARVEAPARLR